jgi:ATP-binding cassette, subfamily C (CFTR/MRP), member 1
MVGGQSRSALIALIFEKSMVISGRAKAGGRADGSDGSNPPVEEEKVKDGKNKEKISAKDAAAGPGDGIGWGNGRVVNLMVGQQHLFEHF